MSSSRHELQPLLTAVKANGFKVVPNGKQHLKVLDSKGRVVQDDDGPVIISSSPSEFRARDMHTKRLIKAGILKEDPWKPQKKKAGGGKNPLQDPEQAKEIHAKRIEAIKEKSREGQRLTLELRSRLEPLIVKLGGWNNAHGRAVGSGVRASELGLMAKYFAEVNHRVGVWTTDNSAKTASSQLKTGNTLGEKSREFFSLLIDELERAYKQGGNEGLRQRYFMLLKQSKGIVGEESALPEPGGDGRVNGRTPAAEEGKGEIVRSAVALQGDTTEIPTLALQCLAEMLIGRAVEAGDIDKVRDRALELAGDVLRIELGGERVS